MSSRFAAHSARVTAMEGRGRAFVTFLMRNDHYLPGALVMAYGLRRQRARGDLVCLVTPEVSSRARAALWSLFDRVIEIEEISLPNARHQSRQDIPHVFTRLNALRLGRDGDLGCAYDRIVLLDADVLPLRRFDSLFELPAPAGIINEAKDHVVEASPGGSYRLPASAITRGSWVWHEIYGRVCPHGSPIPRPITDRVCADSANMGVNSCLYVLEPSAEEFWEILEDLEDPIRRRAVYHFRWPEMQYLTMRWSGRWTNVDIRFCSIGGYPDLRLLNGTHFSGFKPWAVQQERAFRNFSRHPDFQLWQQMFLRMLYEDYRELLAFRRLRRVAEGIGEIYGVALSA